MTVVAAIGRRRPSHQALQKLVVTEFKLAWREPVGLLLGVVVPGIFLVIFGLAPGLRKPLGPTVSISYMTESVPLLIALTLCLIALITLPVPIVMQRQWSYLRRLSTTPVAPQWLLAAEVLVSLALATIAMILIVAGAALLFGVPAPGDLPGFALSALLAMGALFALGLIIAALAPDPRIAGPTGAVLLYPLMFFAGLWTPREMMSDLMRNISDFTPLGAAVKAMLKSMQGQLPPAQSLLVMAGYAVVLGFVAVKVFRWQ
jgi:ABC-2 type transport system permease protein